MLGITPNREDAIKFETARIKVLQEERLYIQKKTFTKWVNSFLQKARMELEDLFTDLGDGKKLLKLLEIISGEKLGKPNHGRTRVHKIENVNKSLAFLHTKVRLESIGAEDIVDGNPRLILGLIWTIILRFQIQEIEIDVNEDDESSEKKSAKDALLLWCQRRTAGHAGVDIKDFSVSWRNGLGFNALIHSHRPDLLDYDALVPENHIDNLNNAFDVAQRELGIPRLLDAEDIDTNKPDEKSVITYVASYYHTFARMKSEMKGGRRIANIVAQLMEADRLKKNYEGFTSNLLKWIQKKIEELKDHNFPNSIEGIQRELLKFKEYRTIEKPPKYKERSDVEGLLFGIQTKLKALGQPLYVPPEGKMVYDIGKSWDLLETAEHLREIALREELLRQEKLGNLAYRFERKSVVREGYLKEMIQVLSDPRYGSNLSQVEASVKKHEAISADILAREDRFHNLSAMVQELIAGNYHSKEKVKHREEEIVRKWNNLLELLKKHKLTLTNNSKLMTILREADAITAEIQAIEGSFQVDDYGRHLLSVEDLLQKHALVEMQISSQGEAIRKLNSQAQALITAGLMEAPRLEKKFNSLNSEYEKLQRLAKVRHSKLEESRAYFQFVQDHEEEEAWVIESQRICKTLVPGKDLAGALSSREKHKSLEAEIQGHWMRAQRVIKAGEQLINERHPQSLDIKQRLDDLKSKWEGLQKLAQLKCRHLEDMFEAYQYHADANEAESWIREKITLVSSKDYGKDEPGAQALLQRHNRMEEEIHAYRDDIRRLSDQADKMMKSGIANLNPLDAYADNPNGVVNGFDETEQNGENATLISAEEWVEEIVEKEVLQDVVEEIHVKQVKALYAFQGQGMDIQKGEVMVLVNKANDDWWNVRKINGEDGFVPANYLVEVKPRIVPKVTKKLVKVPEKKMVLKTVLKKQLAPKRKKAPPIPKPPPKHFVNLQENSTVELRQMAISASYEELHQLSKDRKHYLEDAIRLFGFYSECDDFKTWMKDKEKMLAINKAEDSVEVMKKMFENFLTDLSASSRRVEDIDKMVKEFIDSNHSEIAAIKTRQKQIHERWDELNMLKNEIERGLEGATSVELFNRTCHEACDWMLEKLDKIEVDEIGRDMKTVQALQRKHENLERELAPVEEKFNKVNLLADSVKASYPNECSNVNKRQEELKRLWEKVKVKATERRTMLDESLGLQIFQSGSKNLLSWVNNVKEALNNDEPARDVQTAENALKNHTDLGDDIKAHQDEFCDLQDLGVKLLSKSPNKTSIQDTLALLQEEQRAIHRGWQQKADWLQQCMDLQIFNREADHIESITNSHDAYLDFHDMGTNLDDVESLSKRHETFMNTLVAQNDRLKAFSEMADKLISAKHYESQYIDDRRTQILHHRQQIQEKAHQRKDQLIASKSFQEFRAEADEIASWIQEKLKTAADESYRDLTNLERKLQKNEAFEAEVRANEARILTINNVGQQLIQESHSSSEEIKEILDRLNGQWKKLCAQTADKGQKLHQAVAQHSYNRTLEDVCIHLDELDSALASKELGNDLRSVKDLLVKHQNTESDLSAQEVKVTELSQHGQSMAKDGHFDAPNILKAVRGTENRLKDLKGPAIKRRAKLEESLKLHQFNFEVETEMQWIREHLPAAAATDLGHSLIDSLNMSKKHGKLEREIAGHQTVIDKTLKNGNALTEQNHFASEQIGDRCQNLRDSWQNLISLSVERKQKLDLSLRAQQFFSEAHEVEQWMAEKQDVLSSTDFGKDEDASVKLLTKHKAVELEIDTYSGLVQEMGHQAQRMIECDHPEAKVISNRMQVVQQGMRNLHKLASLRCQKLVEVKHQHEYFRESEELQQWMNEEMQQATTEDFGQDYEHLLLLVNKFNDFKLHVESNEGRLSQCQELGKKLLIQDSPFTEEIEAHQEQLGRSWDLLLDCIESRDCKLRAATEIHRFNRDVAEALARIQEKYTSIPNDLGKDMHTTENMLRKHDGFENDLVALEGQIQVIIDDSVRLQESYPGSNADNIHHQRVMILENWEELQERSAARRTELQSANQIHKLYSLIRAWETWAQEVCTSLRGEQKMRDLDGAQSLIAEHYRLRAEIETREEDYLTLIQQCEELVEQKHYAREEISNRSNQLVNLHDELIYSWEQKYNYLELLESLHSFLRDAKQLDTISSQQEAYLSSVDVGSTVEDVAAQMKKHEEFEKVIMAQDERLGSLKETGNILLQQEHFGSTTIQNRMDEVSNRRARVREMSESRRQRLADALLYTQFRRDAAEVEAWIDEKQKELSIEESKMDATSLEDKMKKLQKHQAFKAELTAHSINIDNINKAGEFLLSKGHEASPQVRSQLDHTLQEWNKLLEASAERGRGLEEAQDILEFNNKVEEVLIWIRDKEMMVQAGETGEDYEHCLELQKRLNGVDCDRIDENHIKQMNVLSEKLIGQVQTDTHSVQARKEVVNDKWRSLQGALENYRESLDAALEIHAFNRDVGDTNDRISEKVAALSIEDESKNLEMVQAQQRKQDSIERDVIAIDKKLMDDNNEGQRLIQKYPEMTSMIEEKLSNLQENWRNLISLCHTRKLQLAHSYTMHKFNSDLKELELWVNEMNKRMTSGELANSIAEAQNLLQLHQERKAEIDGRQEVFDSLYNFGQSLMKQRPSSRGVLESKLVFLDNLRRNLSQAWKTRMVLLDQCYSLQILKEQADQAESWLTSKEAYLNNDDLGDSISSVEALLRKHENFEKTMSAQSDKVNHLETSANNLVSSSHYDSAGIASRCQSICQRRGRLVESALLRKKKLLQSKQLQQFLRNIHEVVSWINEKLAVATDDSYRDPTNLLTKIQKHTTFDAELSANKGRVDSIVSEGEKLTSAGHFASSEIQSRTEELQLLWQQLQDQTKLKKDRLTEAYQALLVNRLVEDLDHWMDDVENQLQSEDHGKDLTSVQSLLKKQQLLEMDVYTHMENTEQLKDLAASFQTCNHFMKDDVQEQCSVIIKRYHSLHEPMQIRRDNLEDALLLHQFYRDYDDEISWIQEKEPQAESSKLGNSLSSVQNLQKKHQILESEILAHETLHATVLSKGRQLIRSNHYAASEIERKLQTLQSQIQTLKDKVAVRRLRLQDALESQTFYSEVSEADIWMKEKTPILTSLDTGKDEDSVLSLMKKLEVLDCDIHVYNQNIVKLAQLSQALIERGHFDSQNIASKQAEVESVYEELQVLVQQRRQRLQESQKYFLFLRDVDEIEAWIEHQMVVACSEEYGKDVEHVELLIQKFEGFLNTLQTNEERMAAIKNSSRAMINDGYSQAEAIRLRTMEIFNHWKELKECAKSRQEALTGARTVHNFDRNADETICWINEKYAVLSTDDYGHDLESIQSLVRYHEGFQRDLGAVKEQVLVLAEEVKRLVLQYPDATEHIGAKHEEVTEAWQRLLKMSATRINKLQQAEKLQTYFDDYRELMAWANEMMALITASELAQDVPAARALLDRHKEHCAEIDTRLDSFTLFAEQGESLIAGGHFMAEDIRDRITRLNGALELLLQTWQKRQVIYEQNLDVQLFKQEAEQLETWLQMRESTLHDRNYGDSISTVEELIRKHEDFQKTVDAHEDMFAAIKRITKLEDAFHALKAEEQQQKKVAEQRKEQERLDALKLKEQHRILQVRKQEDEQHRIQDIIFKKGSDRPGNLESELNRSTESLSSLKAIDFPVIPPQGKLYKSASQRSLDVERPAPMARVGSMRTERLKTPLHEEPSSGIKRAESVKLDERKKKTKRTPSFTTRKRAAGSKFFKDDLPPVDCDGYLERKQEVQSGGKRATIRSWKYYYTVLCGQYLLFFKDRDGFEENNIASPTVNLLNAKCQEAKDYTKKKHVFRMQLADGAEFLFAAENESNMALWLKRLSCNVSAPSGLHVKPLPEAKENSLFYRPSGESVDKDVLHEKQQNSQDSVVWVQRTNPATPLNTEAKRTVSEPPRSPLAIIDGTAAKNRTQLPNASEDSRTFSAAGDHSVQNGVSDQNGSKSANVKNGQDASSVFTNKSQDKVYQTNRVQGEENGSHSRQSITSVKELPTRVSRHMSLPPKSQPPGGYLRPTGTFDNRLRTTSSDGSSEGDLHQTDKDRKGKKSMFNLFKKR